MKRTGTKIIAVITALVFMMGLFPVSAGADGESEEPYSIYYSPASGFEGGVSGPRKAKAGQLITVTVNPSSGIQFTSMSVLIRETSEQVQSSGTQFIMPAADVVVHVYGKALTYDVCYFVTPDGGGSVSGPIHVVPGKTVTLTVTPNDGYKLESLKAVNTYTEEELTITDNTFTMPDCDVNVTATFHRTTERDLTYAVSPDGGGSVSGPLNAYEGETVTLTVTPKDGYELIPSSSILQTTPVQITYAAANGSSLLLFATQDSSDHTKFTFPMPAADAAVTAQFQAITDYKYSISVDDAIQNGTVTVSCDEAKKGTEVTLTVTPAEGYELKSLKAVNTYTEEELTITDSKFTMPAGNVQVSAEFAKKAQFTGHNLLLSSEIGVMFKVTLPDGADTTNSYMSFAYSDGRAAVTQNTTDAEKVDDENAYWFTCFINPLELSDKITATFNYGDGKTVVNEFSAMDYITYVTTNYTARTQLVALVNALQNFGHYMQSSGWTDNNTHTAIAASGTLDESSITAAAAGVSEMGVNMALDGSGISESGASFYLTLNSDTVINLLIKPDDGVTISESQTYETVTEGGVTKYKFVSPKIGAANLDKFYTFSIVTNQGTATIKACAMSYADAVLSGDAFTAEKKYAMTAYYEYYQAAEKYAATKNS